MGKTFIEWAHSVWNPITGCTKVSEGCRNCYAERMAKRLKGRFGYPAEDPFRVTLHHDKLDKPLQWKKPRRIFVCSMGDLFHKDVSFDNILRLLLVIRSTPRHTYIILTKRPERMKLFFNEWFSGAEALADCSLKIKGIPKNIWLGVSVEDQKTADERIPILLQIPAAVRFVSIEPMLGPVDIVNQVAFRKFQEWLKGNTQYPLDWIICGGESGPGARPMHPDWVRSIRDQCKEARVKFFFKQWGKWIPEFQWSKIPLNLKGKKTVRLGNIGFWGVGKKQAGRLMDGKLHDEYPEGEQLNGIT